MGNNSTIILGAFALFLVFGYLSVLRSIARLYFPSSSIKTAYLSAFRDSRVLANFGSSALFISIPATSLLLFWGWVPALIWMLIAHLLLDSILHLQVAAAERIHPESTRLSGAADAPSTLIHRVLLSGFYILLTATALSFLANLIDRQSGLIFALLCLFPAHKLIQADQHSPTVNVIRVALAIVVAFLGVMFAHQLGFAIYGEWQPLAFIGGASLDWLALNNQTILAACLLMGCVEISRGTSFEHTFATFTGALLVLASLLLATKFLVLQAPLDAPLNASTPAAVTTTSAVASDLTATVISLPSFAMVSLILFWTLGGLLLRLSHERDNSNSQGDISSRFGRLQWEGTLQLLFSLVLLLSLAAAVGIGAWNSHYIGSPLDQDLIKHFDLAISSISALLDPSEQTGTLVNTLLLVGLVFTGFSFLISIVRRLRTSSNAPFVVSEFDRSGRARATHGAQIVMVFLLSCYFIKHGVGVDFWAVAGCLAWTLFASYTLSAAIAVQSLPKGAANTSFANYVILIVVILGFVQSMAFVIYWYFDERLVAAALLQILILFGVSTWFDKFSSVLSGLKQIRQAPAFDD